MTLGKSQTTSIVEVAEFFHVTFCSEGKQVNEAPSVMEVSLIKAYREARFFVKKNLASFKKNADGKNVLAPKDLSSVPVGERTFRVKRVKRIQNHFFLLNFCLTYTVESWIIFA